LLDRERISKSYSEFMLNGNLPAPAAASSSAEASSPSEPVQGAITHFSVMYCHYYAWKMVAETYNFDVPDPEEVMTALL
jgi:hypothetical protein